MEVNLCACVYVHCMIFLGLVYSIMSTGTLTVTLLSVLLSLVLTLSLSNCAVSAVVYAMMYKKLQRCRAEWRGGKLCSTPQLSQSFLWSRTAASLHAGGRDSVKAGSEGEGLPTREEEEEERQKMQANPAYLPVEMSYKSQESKYINVSSWSHWRRAYTDMYVYTVWGLELESYICTVVLSKLVYVGTHKNVQCACISYIVLPDLCFLFQVVYIGCGCTSAIPDMSWCILNVTSVWVFKGHNYNTVLQDLFICSHVRIYVDVSKQLHRLKCRKWDKWPFGKMLLAYNWSE